MSAKVLGRITTSVDRPRGPDVQMSLTVPEEWLSRGATLEIELPRNLACAACQGGGCDACERSGAVSLRGRKDPAEVIEVTLPQPTVEDEALGPSRTVVVRIPHRGGRAPEGSDLPRGNLLLSVSLGPAPAKGVRRLAQPSEPPPPEIEVVSIYPSAPPPAPESATARTPWHWIALAVLAAAIAAWLVLR